MIPLPTLNCPISARYHVELSVAINFYRHYLFLPTKLYHILCYRY